MGVEVKSRLSCATAQKENDRVFTLGFDESKYQVIEAESEKLRQYVNCRAECVQLLHHALVFDLEYVLLLIGNDHNITSGTWVRFSNELKFCYGELLKDIYEETLQWAYEGNKMKMPDDIIKKCITKRKRTLVDYETFERNYYCWKELMMSKSSPLPLPSCKRIIPAQHSMWNLNKGGSDTMTKLMWKCKHEPPIINPQTKAIRQMFSLMMTCIHRCIQVYSSKHPDNYKSLQAYRKAANERISFTATMFHLHRKFLNLARCSHPRGLRSLATPTTSGSPDDVSPSSASKLQPAEFDFPTTEEKFPAVALGGTPQKIPKRRYSDDEKVSSHAKRQHECTGPYLIPLDSTDNHYSTRHKCFVCDRKSNWRCYGCRHVFYYSVPARATDQSPNIFHYLESCSN